MDLKGSLVNSNLRIYPAEDLVDFLKTIPVTKDVPTNVLNIIKDENKTGIVTNDIIDTKLIQITNRDLEIIRNIKKNIVKPLEKDQGEIEEIESGECKKESTKVSEITNETDSNSEKEDLPQDEVDKPFLTTSDLDWLYIYIKSKHDKGEKLAYLHELLEGVEIKMPKNTILKRNPDLEARCVKLRAQQEAREYRKMTKGVDNVRIRYPEDSISYQMKQLNRHLIAIGQFLLSIFAGFLFGFRGVEWMVGNLDFGFRLLLGVMCALVIALAEIYFLAKKLNEELSVPETIQLGGPAKFVNEVNPVTHSTKNAIDKEHQD